MKDQKVKPDRNNLCGVSPSQFKTLLKLRGHKVSKDFFKRGSVSSYKGRLYRWRWWSTAGFVVDVSCPNIDFDRWANSTEYVLDFKDWIRE